MNARCPINQANLPAVALALVFISTTVFAEQVGVVVFDASGSMWGRVAGGQTRIEVAREVVGQYLMTRDASAPISVIAYGHNRRGDCRDIEVLSPMGRTSGRDMAGRLRGLTPRGMTPLTDSLRLARGQIPATAESADIILVTDGLETCGGDPCALAAEFAREGIKIRAHVVGFGLTGAQVRALSCITEPTGGRLFETNSGAELADALRQVTVVSPPAAPVTTPPPPAREATFDLGERAEAGFTYSVRWRGEARYIDYIGFVPRGESRAPAGPGYGVIGGTAAQPANPRQLRAPTNPGHYDLILRAAGGDVIARQAIEVVAPNMGFEPVGSVEPGSRVTFIFRGPNQLGERVVIARPADAPATYQPNWAYALSSNGNRTLRVPQEPGEYEVRYLNARQTEVMFNRRFGVGVPFTDSDNLTVARLGELAAAATRADPSQDNPPAVSATFRLPEGSRVGAVTWSAVPLDADLPPEPWTQQQASEFGEGTFAPGRYRVTATAGGEARFRADVEILPAQANIFTLQPVNAPNADGLAATLTGPWRLYMITPHDNPTPPVPMLSLDLTQQEAAQIITGNWTAEPALLGNQQAGGTLLTATLDSEGLLRITLGRTTGLPGEIVISMRPYETGFAGSMSAGRRGMRALLWRDDRPLPALAPLKEVLHGPAP